MIEKGVLDVEMTLQDCQFAVWRCPVCKTKARVDSDYSGEVVCQSCNKMYRVSGVSFEVYPVRP